MAASGELVEARGETWIVARQEQYDACTIVTLEGVGAGAGRSLKLVAPFDRLRAVRRRPSRGSRRQVLRLARSTVARARKVDGLWAAADSQLTLLPYQLEPALAVLGGSTRVLLADAVGLGKTVQAGLILAELRARGLANRALVLTPAGLRHAWAAELRERFGLAATVLDQASLTTESWRPASDINPWSCHSTVITSIDFVKRPDVLASAAAAPFDLVIADEAHHLTPGSDRGAAAGTLATQATWVVLLTATPHSGDEAAFAYLQSIGAHRDDGLTVFRRTRGDAGWQQARKSILVAVRASPEEREMLDAIDRYTSAIWRARGEESSSIRLLAITLRRRAASSAHALMKTLSRRRAILGSQPDSQSSQPSLPWEDLDDSDADAPDRVLARPGLDDPGEERSLLDRLLRLTAAALDHPSKVRRLLRLKGLVREPLIVFSEYRDTLDALAAALPPTASLAVIHGGLPPDLRRHAVERFTTGAADILLATDAAGEGLNLQHRCRLVVTIELPWNPLRLEQRIGRVDRIGQARRVHAIHLFHRDTVEDTVLARLERRQSRAAAALDALDLERVDEADVAAAMFEGVAVELAAMPVVPSMRVDRAREEAARLQAQRTWRSHDAEARAPLWAPAPRRSSPSRVVCLLRARRAGASGLTIDEGCDAVLVTLARAAGRLSRRDHGRLIRALERLVGDSVGWSALDIERRNEVEAALRPFRTAVLNRLEAIRAAFAQRRGRQWQASLFDRRAEREEGRRLETLQTIDAHLARAMALVSQLTPEAGAPHRRLIAVWPLES